MIARLWRLVDRRSLLVTAGCLVLWRLLDQIPVTDVAGNFLSARLNASHGTGFFAAIGPQSLPVAGYSVGFLGIGPYITALMVVSVAAGMSSRIRAHDLRRWTCGLALLLALAQAYSWTLLVGSGGGMAPGIDWFARLTVCLELVGGTAVMILVAGLMDELGLGFGWGAPIFFALGPLAFEVHRLAGYFTTWPSTEALYRPLLVWAGFSIGVTIAGVAVLLAVRRVSAPALTGSARAAETELAVVTSGVLRPSVFGFGIVFMPAVIANQYASVSVGAKWFAANWFPYAGAVWLEVAYVALQAGMVVLFAIFVAHADTFLVETPRWAYRHIVRLALVGGVFLALIVVVTPVADDLATGWAGTLIPMSGFDTLLLVAVILIVVRTIEGHTRVVLFTASPTGLP